jgi:hypothetical protein
VVALEGWGICLVFLTAIERVFVEIQTLVCLRSCCLPTKISLSELGPTSHLKRYTMVGCFAEALPTGQTIKLIMSYTNQCERLLVADTVVFAELVKVDNLPY